MEIIYLKYFNALIFHDLTLVPELRRDVSLENDTLKLQEPRKAISFH